MKKKKQTGCCPHNQWVQCSVPDCPSCGWDPETFERRLRKIRTELQKKEGRAVRVWKIG